MKKAVSIAILAALLLCANASILEHLYNSTHLRGNVKLDTTDGVKLGYNGGVFFDNGFLGFEIANIGGNIKAAVRPGGTLGNHKNVSVDYSGDIEVTHGSHSANISVDGTTDISADYTTEKTESGGNLAYNASVKNENQWKVNAGNLTAEGTSEACIHSSGEIEKDGNEISVEKKIKGGVRHNGTLKHGDHEDSFEVLKLGKIELEKDIYIHNGSDIGGLLPTIGYAGKAKVKGKKHIQWNNESVSHKGKGKGKFSGLLWYEGDEQNNTYLGSVKHVKSAEFVHGGKEKINGKHHAVYGGAGIVGAASSAVMKFNNDTKDFKGGFFDSGNLYYAGVKILKPKSEDELLIKKLQESPDYFLGDMEDVDKKDKKDKVKYAAKTSWVAGKGVEVTHNEDKSIDVNTHGGALWEVDGVVKHKDKKKPIHKHDEVTYNSSFTYDVNTSTIKNILMKLGKDPKKVEELRQRFKMMNVVAQ